MSIQNSPFFARLVFAAFFLAGGWFLCTKFQSCQKQAQIPILQARLLSRLDAVATQIDSLQEVNDSLSGWIILYKNQKPAVKYAQNNIFLTDTIWQREQLIDTIEVEKIVYLDNPIPKREKKAYLELPLTFTLSDTPHLKIIGHVDSQGVHTDSMRFINTLALRDQIHKTFFQEQHTLTYAQSNPYISSFLPAYTYQKPTKKGQFLQKTAWFLLGAGTGYGIRLIQAK